jgi:hypothetical protein
MVLTWLSHKGASPSQARHSMQVGSAAGSSRTLPGGLTTTCFPLFDKAQSKLSFLQHSLLLVEQGIKPLSGQVMVLPIGNDMQQITLLSQMDQDEVKMVPLFLLFCSKTCLRQIRLIQ